VTTIFRHGRHIEVETLDTGAKPSKARRRDANLFIKVPLRLVMAASKTIRTRNALLVLILLQYMAWKARSSTFACPNELMERCGVSRKTKHRALAELEAAGVITVRRQPRRSPIVTLNLYP
jgi:DNA-binding MarR family transcriptional regulator